LFVNGLRRVVIVRQWFEASGDFFRQWFEASDGLFVNGLRRVVIVLQWFEW
jgi:hypothetical protein